MGSIRLASWYTFKYLKNTFNVANINLTFRSHKGQFDEEVVARRPRHFYARSAIGRIYTLLCLHTSTES